MLEIFDVIFNAIINAKSLAISAFATLISATAVAVSAMYAIFDKVRITRRKQRKRANAVYHHMQLSEKALHKALGENTIDKLRKKIESDPKYTPYAPMSTWDDLTYDQVVSAVESLSDDGEKIVMAYFYNSRMIDAILESFSLDIVRALSQERKLSLLEELGHRVEETNRYVKQAREKNIFGK